MYYDVNRCTYFVVLVCLNMGVIFCLKLLHTSFFKLLYHSHAVGSWRRHFAFMNHAWYISLTTAISKLLPKKHRHLYQPSMTLASAANAQSLATNGASSIQEWSSKRLPYFKDECVTYKGCIYVALGNQNMGAPNDFANLILFVFFERPHVPHTCLLMFQSVITVWQLLLMIVQSEFCCWETHFVQLLFNFYILILCIDLRSQIREIESHVESQEQQSVHVQTSNSKKHQ